MLFLRKFLDDIPHRPEFAFRDDRMLILEVAVRHPKISVYNSVALLHRTHNNDRLQATSGLKQSVQNYQHLNIYKHILDALEQNDELTARRKAAAIKVLWPLAHWISKDYLADAEKLVEWIYHLDPNFKIPERGLLGFLYNKLGFKRTEKLLSSRRSVKKLFK